MTRIFILVLATPLAISACGPPPVPVDPAPRVPTAATHGPEHGAAVALDDLRVGGRLRLTGGLESVTEGRLFVFVRDAHSGALILNRAYELTDPAMTAADGERVLPFELGPEDRLGSGAGSDGHLTLEVRLDADGEVLSSDDALAVVRQPFDAGDALGLEVTLTPTQAASDG